MFSNFGCITGFAHDTTLWSQTQSDKKHNVLFEQQYETNMHYIRPAPFQLSSSRAKKPVQMCQNWADLDAEAFAQKRAYYNAAVGSKHRHI